jgi:outer membrane protein OmpA-like peptidoglycan-associated protein
MYNLLTFLFILFVNSLFAQQEVYEIKSTAINTPYAEFGTIYLKENGVLFASSKKNSDDKSFNKNRRKNNRQLHLELYKSQLSNPIDISTQTEKFTNDVKNKVFESDIAFTPDFKTVYFTWNNFYNTKKLDSAKWMSLRVVKGSIDENLNISNISNLPFNSSEYSVRNPYVSKNGKQLFFVSDMPNGFGETDIYVVDIHADGSFGKPENLGPTINTKKAELFPFVDQDNTLYFASYGHKGKGGLDIFKSNFQNGNYEKATNLPKPINSKFDDFAFVIDNTTHTGFFTSSRVTGMGDVDIYGFKISYKQCQQVLITNILDSEYDMPLDNVTISIYSNDELIETKKLDGNFSFDVKCDEQYKLIIQKENYQTEEIIFKTPKKTQEIIVKTIQLAALKCNQNISITIEDPSTELPIASAQIAVYKDTKLLEEIKTLENGSFYYKIDCDARYILRVSKNNYTSSSVAINATNFHGKTHTHKIFLNPIHEFVTIRNQRMLKLLPLQFDLDKSDIKKESAIQLNHVVGILKKYPNMRIAIKIHTDSRGQDRYNYELSNQRAEATKDFIVSKGIDQGRILSKGYGETELINKCSNGVECTDEEHQKNRRSEFIVLEN